MVKRLLRHDGESPDHDDNDDSNNKHAIDSTTSTSHDDPPSSVDGVRRTAHRFVVRGPTNKSAVVIVALIVLVVASIGLQTSEMRTLSSLYDTSTITFSEWYQDATSSLSSMTESMNTGLLRSGTQPSSSSSSSSLSIPSSKPRIAIISGFVTRKTGKGAPQIKPSNYDHMINKACYSNLWGYDFIYNTSWGFDKDVGSKYWLEYGTWHRVPHMEAALGNYDWIVYADVDWYVRDMTIPLESFIHDWEMHGLHNVSVFLPVDVNGVHLFSAYIVMIRNNDFGRQLIHNWLRFADGLCENGNFNSTPGKYGWGDSDQPGIWYALAKTHSDFAGNNFEAECQDGFIKTSRVMGPEMRQYFLNHGVKFGGNQGKDLYNIPKDQHIIWSKIDNVTKGGLGIQQTYGHYARAQMPNAFGFHKKQQLVGQFKADIETCKRERGCYGYYDDDGIFQIGCNKTSRLLSD